jgi:hypothetical protein
MAQRQYLQEAQVPTEAGQHYFHPTVPRATILPAQMEPTEGVVLRAMKRQVGRTELVALLLLLAQVAPSVDAAATRFLRGGPMGVPLLYCQVVPMVTIHQAPMVRKVLGLTGQALKEDSLQVATLAEFHPMVLAPLVQEAAEVIVQEPRVQAPEVHLELQEVSWCCQKVLAAMAQAKVLKVRREAEYHQMARVAIQVIVELAATQVMVLVAPALCLLAVGAAPELNLR